MNPDDLIKPLRGMYLAQLRERTATVEAFMARCRTGALPADEAAVMEGLAHKLAGSGTTYGFPLITRTARALEDALHTDPGTAAALAPLAESLLHACAQALLLIERDSIDPAPHAELAVTASKPVILAVDDDPVIRETITALFGRDFTVLTAADGSDGLRLVRERVPRLVLVDETMPNMSGLDLVKALRAEKGHEDIPVIMITSHTRPQDVVRALAAGVTDYIAKPFRPEELVTKVRELLRRAGKTVLIADDDPAIRDLLAYKFRLAGLRVLTASDGEEALRVAREYRPHLAILDRMMPGLDGVAVLRTLRDEPDTRDMPVIFLTAMRQEKDILEGFRIGVSDYVIKPFMPEEVLARGMRLLGIEEGK
jgi:DNA-binding response OmpR family regulator/HPt (histidine-containing phosphotransfer) domain-containing protein